ncbi:MAG: patatin [Clostridiales bacterium GWB2_37_7]|nr:MAG: patatin [Clostridiales bacterium GWB2_37_7]
MKYHFRNLVFEGGGVKGIAYIGALSVLEQKGVLQNIKRVGGTSAGAIVALLLALDFSVAEIKEILWTMNFERFLDSSWGVIRDTERLLKDFGWYKGDYFQNWIGDLVEQKTGSRLTTFLELDNLKLRRQLYLIGTNLSTGFAEIFSHMHSPEMTLVEGVRVSMSIPLFFTAVRNKYKDVCVDGGALENYPIKLFDRRSYIDRHFRTTDYYNEVNGHGNINEMSAYVFNMETLGFRLDSWNEIKMFEGLEKPEHYEIRDFFDYIKRLITTLLDSQQNRHLHSDDWQRSVYIDSLGIKTTDFEISEAQKNALVEAGILGTEKYFNWFESTKDNITNRPRGYYDIIG